MLLSWVARSPILASTALLLVIQGPIPLRFYPLNPLQALELRAKVTGSRENGESGGLP
jgi:hypothetical protein